jgi:hypothetical protein
MTMASAGRTACLLDEDKTAKLTLAIPLEAYGISSCIFGSRPKIAQALHNILLKK